MLMPPPEQFFHDAQFLCATSEPPDIGEIDDEGIDLGLSDLGAIQFYITVDVDPAQVGTNCGIFRDRVVQTDLGRDTKTVIQIKITQGRAFIEEIGVVQTKPDIGFPCRLRGEVVVDRQRRWQVFDVARIADARDIDIMLERPGGQQLDANIVLDEVFGGDGGADAVADIGFASRKRPIVRLRQNGTNTHTDSPIALRLGIDTGRGKKPEKNCHTTFFHGDFLIRMNTGSLQQHSSFRHDLDQSRRCFGGKNRTCAGQAALGSQKGTG